jgi:hypothetical protein
MSCFILQYFLNVHVPIFLIKVLIQNIITAYFLHHHPLFLYVSTAKIRKHSVGQVGEAVGTANF